MPRKGTKKVRAHKRRKLLMSDKTLGVRIVDPFAKPTRVREHYRSKPKKKKKSKKSDSFFGW